MAFEVADDGRAFIIERRGGIKMFDPVSQSVKPVGKLTVNNASKVGNGEQGLVGITLDPKFNDNGWIYLYYYHPKEEKAILSRWDIADNMLVANSEIVMLEWSAQRETCCHTGGGMDWDDEGNLYLTVGNNRGNNITAHTDERPERASWDDQGGAANTNSLEGKILRIHPEPDGTYTIPEGNLFPKGTPKTRPEIYTMGHRNAWRITHDSKTGFIYWGEVGPDGRQDNENGPMGYDEFNQAKGPGFFGWPYFVGESSYPIWDYESMKPGPYKDRAKPINQSPNNTGLVELPPLAPSFIYYPYGTSEKFPELGTGGRSATGGPVYRRADFNNPARPWPEYFEGKWLISELSRRMILAVGIDDEGKYLGMERLFPDYRPVEPIDMKFGPSGDLYVLEYGGRWFRSSPDAKLTRIEFEAGNRAPIAVAKTNKIGGKPPFKVKLSSEGSEDFDGDPISYRWDIVDDSEQSITLAKANPEIELTDKGVYNAVLTVSDPSGANSSQSVKVISGNEPPKVSIDVMGNQSFYFPNAPFSYKVNVADAEDGSLEKGTIDSSQVKLTIDYVESGFDLSVLDKMEESDESDSDVSPVVASLITQGKCQACHLPNAKLVGPSYQQIAEKYQDDQKAVENLSKKVVSGGVGVWGQIPMPPNSAINESEATTILKYILESGGLNAGRPLSGQFVAEVPQDPRSRGGNYVLRALYKDSGNGDIPSLSSQGLKILKSPSLQPASADKIENIEFSRFGSTVKNNAVLVFNDLDLRGVKSIDVGAFAFSFRNRIQEGGDIEIREGSPTGPILGKASVQVPQPNFGGGARGGRGGRFGREPIHVEIKETREISSDLYFLFHNSEAQNDDTLMSLMSITLSSAAPTE